MKRILILALVLAGTAWPTISRAYASFEFEAWPTAITSICAAPCYQVRMFLRDDAPSLERTLQAFQMDVDVQEGAAPTSLTVPPQRNTNSGPGTIRTQDEFGLVSFLPWDLSSIVGQSPTVGFDVLAVHAASYPFSVTSLAAQLSDPAIDCTDDPAKCALVKEALALNRLYLGFFNVTRTDALPGGGIFCFQIGVPELCAEAPAGPYFVARFGQLATAGPDDLLDALLADPHGHRPILVPFLPEPETVILLVLGLVALGCVRRRG